MASILPPKSPVVPALTFCPHDFVIQKGGIEPTENIKILERFAKLPRPLEHQTVSVSPDRAKGYITEYVYPWLLCNVLKNLHDRGEIGVGKLFNVPGENPQLITEIDFSNALIRTRKGNKAAQWLSAPCAVWLLTRKYAKKRTVPLYFIPTTGLDLSAAA